MLEIDGLDPGIAPYVEILWTAGLDTYESCEGGQGHSYNEPAVRFRGSRTEGFWALHVAARYGLPVKELRRFWTLDRLGEPTGPYWELVFRETASPDPHTDDSAGDPPHHSRGPAALFPYP